MTFKLVVVRPFGTHAPGDVITASGDMDAILKGELAAHVVRVQVPESKPAAAPSVAPAVAPAVAPPVAPPVAHVMPVAPPTEPPATHSPEA
ncbi:MAG: hypothetical protein JO264_13320 [Acidisphaera sp.]|nr:hypothetical protein [Acidisphaera sp.]